MQREGAPYHVTKLYDEQGRVSAPYVDAEFQSFGMTWDQAMADPRFSAIIERDLQAELIADAPLTHLADMAPNRRVRTLFAQWLAFIDRRLAPWTTGGAIHFRPHWARVLMLALVIGDAAGMPDADLNALAMAAVFHDSRRKNPYLDTGHGARAASYYADFAAQDSDSSTGAEDGGNRPDAASPLRTVAFDPRVYLAMQWHDRDDAEGVAAIKQAMRSNMLTDLITGDVPDGPAGQGVRETIADGARASGHDLYLMFKDADALDRVRLGVEGLDTRYLRTSYAQDLVAFAHDLYRKSEQIPGDSAPDSDALDSSTPDGDAPDDSAPNGGVPGGDVPDSSKA